ncbi:MAG: hypothetical protein LAP86_19940 [Acidobacteriia bacterium]|nr:hypothetical protein [Terriglobia bacterium]
MRLQELFRRATIIVFIIASSVLAQGQAAWNFPDFSATQVLDSRKADISMKVYRAGDSLRVDRSGALSTLYMPSKSKVYNLTTYPDHSHQCVVMKPEQAKMLPSPLELLQGSDMKRTAVGTEVVDGHPCKIEKVIVTRPDGKTIESKVWEAQDLKGIPVKIESHIGEFTLSAVYRDISTGTPDKQLFAVPEKCTPFEKMGQVVEQRIVK